MEQECLVRAANSGQYSFHPVGPDSGRRICFLVRRRRLEYRLKIHQKSLMQTEKEVIK